MRDPGRRTTGMCVNDDEWRRGIWPVKRCRSNRCAGETKVEDPRRETGALALGRAASLSPTRTGDGILEAGRKLTRGPRLVGQPRCMAGTR